MGSLTALAQAFGLLADAIAADWKKPGGSEPWGTREQVEAAMIDLALGMPEKGLPGFIHPSLKQDRRLLGFWTM